MFGGSQLASFVQFNPKDNKHPNHLQRYIWNHHLLDGGWPAGKFVQLPTNKFTGLH